MSALDQLVGLVPPCEMLYRADFGHPPVEWHHCGAPGAMFFCADGEDPGMVFCLACVFDQGLLAADHDEARTLGPDELASYATGLFDGVRAQPTPTEMIGFLYGHGIEPPPHHNPLYRYGWFDGIAVLCGPTWEAYEKGYE